MEHNITCKYGRKIKVIIEDQEDNEPDYTKEF